MKVWDENIGGKEFKARYELPEDHISIHKVVAAIIFLSIVSGIMLLLVFVRQSQDESFKRFVERGNAGVYQGVTMSPLACDGCHRADRNHDYKEGWLIAGAGDEGVRKIKEGR